MDRKAGTGSLRLALTVSLSESIKQVPIEYWGGHNRQVSFPEIAGSVPKFEINMVAM